MKPLLLSLILTIALALTACQGNRKRASDTLLGLKEVAINVITSEVKSRGQSALSERAISKLTVVVYANNGDCIQEKSFIDVSGSVRVAPVEKSLFPLHIFAVANFDNKSSVWPWGITPSDWQTTTHNTLDRLSLWQRVSGKTIIACTAPLPMYGQSSMAINASAATITLTRPVVCVKVSNTSSSLSSLVFTGLAVELSVDVNGGISSTPTDKAHDYTYTDNNTFTPLATTRNYYFMPTTTASLSITDAGGVVRNKRLPTLISNHALSITVYDKTIECGMSIEVNPEWQEEVAMP
ncbi:MAG: hypothetical protein RSA50_05875 [Mucinivorans sp.]